MFQIRQLRYLPKGHCNAKSKSEVISYSFTHYFQFGARHACPFLSVFRDIRWNLRHKQRYEYHCQGMATSSIDWGPCISDDNRVTWHTCPSYIKVELHLYGQEEDIWFKRKKSSAFTNGWRDLGLDQHSQLLLTRWGVPKGLTDLMN